MNARLATQDGIVEIELDPDETTRPVDVAAALADEAAVLRAISSAEEAVIERIAAGIDAAADDVARRAETPYSVGYVRGMRWTASFVRSRRWARR